MLTKKQIIGISILVILVGFFMFWGKCQAATVEISWTPNSETDIAGYKVYSGTVPGEYGDPIDVGNKTSCDIELNPAVGTVYYFAITAYNTSALESVKSGEVSVFVPTKTPPAAPGQIVIIVRP